MASIQTTTLFWPVSSKLWMALSLMPGATLAGFPAYLLMLVLALHLRRYFQSPHISSSLAPPLLIQQPLIKPTEISGGKIIAPDISTITSVGKLYSCQTKTSASTLKSVEQATTLVNNRNCVYTATTETPSLRKPRLTKASHEPIFLAHNREVQALMDGHNIARGVQVELARGVTQGWWGWNEITPTVLEQLRGSNAEVANKISTIIGKESRLYSPSAVATRKEIL